MGWTEPPSAVDVRADMGRARERAACPMSQSRAWATPGATPRRPMPTWTGRRSGPGSAPRRTQRRPAARSPPDRRYGHGARRRRGPAPRPWIAAPDGNSPGAVTGALGGAALGGAVGGTAGQRWPEASLGLRRRGGRWRGGRRHGGRRPSPRADLETSTASGNWPASRSPELVVHYYCSSPPRLQADAAAAAHRLPPNRSTISPIAIWPSARRTAAAIRHMGRKVAGRTVDSPRRTAPTARCRDRRPRRPARGRPSTVVSRPMPAAGRRGPGPCRPGLGGEVARRRARRAATRPPRAAAPGRGHGRERRSGAPPPRGWREGALLPGRPARVRAGSLACAGGGVASGDAADAAGGVGPRPRLGRLAAALPVPPGPPGAGRAPYARTAVPIALVISAGTSMPVRPLTVAPASVTVRVVVLDDVGRAVGREHRQRLMGHRLGGGTDDLRQHPQHGLDDGRLVELLVGLGAQRERLRLRLALGEDDAGLGVALERGPLGLGWALTR